MLFIGLAVDQLVGSAVEIQECRLGLAPSPDLLVMPGNLAAVTGEAHSLRRLPPLAVTIA